MKIFFDTEFTGLWQYTTLISIGLVDENGRTFYAEFNDFDRHQTDDWIKDNVLKHCKYINTDDYNSEIIYHLTDDNISMIGSRGTIAYQLNKWLSVYDDVQLVSDVCHYDMVLFINLFGNAFRIPNNVNPVCYDINQDIAKFYGISNKEAFDKSREEIVKDCNILGDKHNSLYDAKVIKEIYNKINNDGR